MSAAPVFESQPSVAPVFQPTQAPVWARTDLGTCPYPRESTDWGMVRAQVLIWARLRAGGGRRGETHAGSGPRGAGTRSAGGRGQGKERKTAAASARRGALSG
eukprot:3590087-Rhodomonas_salina.1